MRIKKTMIASLGVILYIAFVLIAEMCVVQIKHFTSYAAAVAFTLVSFLAISVIVLLQAATNIFKIQWFVPIISITFFYLIAVDVINLFLIKTLSNGMFILIHMGTVLLYYIAITPMALMGIKKGD